MSIERDLSNEYLSTAINHYKKYRKSPGVNIGLFDAAEFNARTAGKFLLTTRLKVFNQILAAERGEQPDFISIKNTELNRLIKAYNINYHNYEKKIAQLKNQFETINNSLASKYNNLKITTQEDNAAIALIRDIICIFPCHKGVLAKILPCLQVWQDSKQHQNIVASLEGLPLQSEEIVAIYAEALEFAQADIKGDELSLERKKQYKLRALLEYRRYYFMSENDSCLEKMRILAREANKPIHYQCSGKTYYPHVIENLVLEGGGVKGLGYVSALEVLYENGLLNRLERIAGTSAGAIVAALSAMGFHYSELGAIMREIDFADFLDANDPKVKEFFLTLKEEASKEGFSVDKLPTLLDSLFPAEEAKFLKNALMTLRGKGNPGMYVSLAKSYINGTVGRIKKRFNSLLENLNTGYGFFEGEFFRDWLINHINKKLGILLTEKGWDASTLTFRELHELRGEHPQLGLLDLFVVACNITKSDTETFSWQTTPDVIIVDAVRASMGFPLVFKPTFMYIKNAQDKRVKRHPKDLFVDGGVLKNFPMKIFDTGQRKNPRTLGLKLDSSEEINSVLFNKYTNSYPTGIFSYGKMLYGLTSQAQLIEHKEEKDKFRTVYINTDGVDTLDFNMNEKQIALITTSGRLGAEIFIAEMVRNAKQLRGENRVEKLQIYDALRYAQSINYLQDSFFAYLQITYSSADCHKAYKFFMRMAREHYSISSVAMCKVHAEQSAYCINLRCDVWILQKIIKHEGKIFPAIKKNNVFYSAEKLQMLEQHQKPGLFQQQQIRKEDFVDSVNSLIVGLNIKATLNFLEDGAEDTLALKIICSKASEAKELAKVLELTNMKANFANKTVTFVMEKSSLESYWKIPQCSQSNAYITKNLPSFSSVSFTGKSPSEEEASSSLSYG